MTEPQRDRAYLTTDEVEFGREVTDTELDEGETEAPASIAGLADLDLRDGETDDPNVAAEEGLTWIPPIDPPVVADADDPEGARVAAGFGVDAAAEPFDADHEGELITAEDDLEARIREALLADSATSRYGDSLILGNRNGTVVVRGTVDDIDDTDDIAAVISDVDGVVEVVDEMEVEALN